MTLELSVNARVDSPYNESTEVVVGLQTTR